VSDGPKNGWIDRATQVGMKFGTWGFGWLRHTRFYFMPKKRLEVASPNQFSRKSLQFR
jgi:hypothetical protein